ncbi:endonuclease/exonuclease/phosphatase family protein [Falsiroseomonas sp. E2-1-a20]|uniref:endonuclease/exonuclease/phosphatase family protein n=1 Tax=Falsiroseomonas sp. E2-1-a20 TaxID=3239300 RepID=UPI003F3E7D00
MMPTNRTPGRVGPAIARYLVFPVMLLIAVASLLPLIETNAWFVRLLDFARLQFMILLVVLLVLYWALRRPRNALGTLPILLISVAIGYHVYRLHPYVPFFGESSAAVAECPAGADLRVLVANLQKGNERADELFRMIREADPHLVLAMETDAWWDQRLAALNPLYPHRAQHIPEDHAFYGMHLLSRLELVGPEVRFLFDTFSPSIHTDVRLGDGTVVAFHGLHPRPPHWLQPSTFRDAHMLAAGLAARESAEPAVVAGDFNAVPWERVTRRAMRIGGLIDPRVGRGFHSTFHAQRPLIFWPLDQVLYQEDFALQDLRVLPGFGSDHYPILVSLCHMPAAARTQAAVGLAPDDLQEARTSIEAARRLARETGG